MTEEEISLCSSKNILRETSLCSYENQRSFFLQRNFATKVHSQNTNTPKSFPNSRLIMARGKRSTKAAEIEEEDTTLTENAAEPSNKRQRVTRSSAKAANSKSSASAKKVADDEEMEEELSTKTAKKTAVRSSKAPAPSTNRAPGIVDPASGLVGAVVFDPTTPATPLDVMLVLVEDTSDRYYIIQCITNAKGEFYTFTRWGATGKAGLNQLFGPFKTIDEAKVIFCEKFDEKTGNDWDTVAMNLNVKVKAGRGKKAAAGGFIKKAGMYDMLAQNTAAAVANAQTAGIKWEYYVDDNVAGKTNGWHPYDKENIGVMEEIFNAQQQNPHANLNNRIVSSDSSGYSYRIDLTKMKQANTATNKSRDIRRVDPTTPGVVTVTQATTATTAPPPPAPLFGGGLFGGGFGGGLFANPIPAFNPLPAFNLNIPPVVKPLTVAAPIKTAAAGGGKVIPIDPNSGLAGSVHQDFDCMLNQVNIGSNNNKFYKIQLVENGGRYTLYTRWGRVGEIGQHQTKVFGNQKQGEAAFKSQFRKKTLNDWDQRDNFTKVQGKYMLLLMDPTGASASAAEVEEEEEESDVTPSTLDAKTQELITFIFDKNMFTNVMTQLKVDTKKLPLGALTKQGIQAGLDALAELEQEIKGANRRPMIVQLCSNFYTLIPHAFPRSQVPPLITTLDEVQEKYDMLNVLLDIENAQGLEKKAKAVKKASTAPKKPNPLDLKYKTLNTDLTLVDRNDPDFGIIETYATNTMSTWGRQKLLNVWRVDRHDEEKRFQAFDAITNRKLLWHGTSVAVIASCLQGGLRIMPHSGGRVGKGIYLASEHGKSSGYTRPGTLNGKQVGLMFLAEGALGEEHHITVDDSSLKAAPKGKDSIIALGAQEPDQTQDTTLVIDGKKITVPQGKPVKRNIKTNFSQTEYLLYSEAQHRIRYICAFEF